MDRYYTELATAFVRGRLRQPDASLEDGVAAGLRLYKFKRDKELPRVLRVLGMLKALGVANLLDIGSGRGAFLWPLLDTMPGVRVTAIDRDEQRASDLGAVSRGGIGRLTVARMDVERLAFAPGAFDVVTMLEVLEHLHDPQAALNGAMSVARRFVLLSVPSTPDDNPEHLRLYTVKQLEDMAVAAGARRVTFEHVLNHRIVLCKAGA